MKSNLTESPLMGVLLVWRTGWWQNLSWGACPREKLENTWSYKTCSSLIFWARCVFLLKKRCAGTIPLLLQAWFCKICCPSRLCTYFQRTAVGIYELSSVSFHGPCLWLRFSCRLCLGLGESLKSLKGKAPPGSLTQQVRWFTSWYPKGTRLCSWSREKGAWL
jgi:hypothetical protein